MTNQLSWCHTMLVVSHHVHFVIDQSLCFEPRKSLLLSLLMTTFSNDIEQTFVVERGCQLIFWNLDYHISAMGKAYHLELHYGLIDKSIRFVNGIFKKCLNVISLPTTHGKGSRRKDHEIFKSSHWQKSYKIYDKVSSQLKKLTFPIRFVLSLTVSLVLTSYTIVCPFCLHSTK